MGDKRKKPHTTKKTNWDNIRSWVGAVLCVAIIVVIATYVAKLVPSSSAYTPGPIGVTPISGTPAIPIPARKVTFGQPVQLTGNLTDPWEYQYHFANSGYEEVPVAAHGDYVVFIQYGVPNAMNYFFVLNWKDRAIDQVFGPGYGDIWERYPALPNIYSPYIVFKSNCNIFLYHIPSKDITTITDDNFTEHGECPNNEPDIHKNLVVWTRRMPEGSLGRIWLYNINDQSERRVDVNPPSNVDQRRPRIFENNVVWQEVFWDDQTHKNHYQLVWYNMKDNLRTIFDIKNPSIFGYDINGEDIIWGDGDLYYHYDMDSGKRNEFMDQEHSTHPSSSFAQNILWEGLCVYSGIEDYSESANIVDITSGSFQTLTESFGTIWNSINISGRESTYSYPPPHRFNMFMAAGKQVGTSSTNLFLVPGTVT